MNELVVQNWGLLVAALLVGLAVAWWIFVARRRTRVSTRSIDTLDEGAAPAARNQALIDTPPAAAPDLPPPPATADADADDLTRIKGLGPKIAALLHGLSVTRFSQIAAWDEAEIDRIDAQMGQFAGRIRRDNWVEQAGLLGADDLAGYEARFGKA
jgi:predicted flap endonuclease-1-like 5' DNA nuclease